MKKQFFLLTLTLLLLPLAAAMAEEVEIDGIRYNLDAGTQQATVIQKTEPKYEGDIAIPPSVSYGGTSYSVTTIGDGAFIGCSGLTSIDIPNSVTVIDSYAFGYSGLTSIYIPNSVTTIGWLAFIGCTSLTGFTVDSANDYYKAVSGVLFNKEGTELICYPIGKTANSYSIPYGVTTIGDYAFDGCSGLTSVDIPNSVTTISDYAFRNCSGLTSAYIPNSVTTIGYGAFFNCTSLTGFAVDSANDYYKAVSGVLFNKEGTELICYPIGKTANSYSIPNGVTTIGDLAFNGCNGLTSIDIPNSVTTIGNQAFGFCDGLTSVTIPNSVTTIGDYAFYVCNNLTSVTVEISNPLSISSNTFDSYANATLYVPVGRKAAYEAAQGWKEFGTIVELEPEPADIADGLYLLKNADTGLYLNKGNKWGYHAVLSEEAMPVSIEKQADGSYTLFFPYGSVRQQLLFRADEEGVYVDYNGQNTGCPYWTITHLGDLCYIQTLTTHAVYGQETLPGTYLGNNPAKEATDQDNNALGVYNDVDGNVTKDMNITWQLVPDGLHTAAQEETLRDLIVTLQELGLDSSWAQSVLDDSESTYSEMFGAISDARSRIEQEQERIAQEQERMAQVRLELQQLISSARQLGVSTTDAQAVYDNADASFWDIRTATSTLRTAYIARLGEGVDKSLLPLDVTSAISNASFNVNDAYGWSYDNSPLFQSYNNAEYFQSAFDLHQTLSGLPNGNYVLRMKGFHRPGYNQTVFTEYQEGTNNASAELYANGEHIVLQHQATGARDNDNLGGEGVSYDGQWWFVPNSMKEARSWFDAEEGYFENVLPVTVTDGTLTIGVRLGESVDHDWVIFDDFRLEYMHSNHLYVDETPSVIAGWKDELNICMRNQDAVNMTDFYLQLPEGMKIVNSAISIASDRSDRHQVGAQWNEAGYYHIVSYSSQNNAFKLNDGQLFTMTVECDENVAPGSYEAKLMNIVMSDTDKTELKQQDVTFTIVVPDLKLGDANGDTKINGMDIVETVNHIMQRPSETFYFDAANLHYDTKINGLDLVKIINLVLSQPISLTAALARSFAPMIAAVAGTDCLNVADVTIKAGESTTQTIELLNPDHAFSLLEFTLKLPEGVAIAKDESDNWAVALSADRFDSTHTLEVEQLADGNYKFLVYSMQNAAIKGSEGAIMTMTLTAEADAPTGTDQALIYDQVFADNNNEGVTPADVTFNISIVGADLPGDVNGDGQVGIGDIVAVTNCMAGAEGSVSQQRADVNGDGNVGIGDIVAITNIMAASN